MFDVSQVDTALREFADYNFAQSPQASGVFGSQRDFVFLREDVRDCVLEIESRGKLFARLIERVIKFLLVHFGDDVERGHLRL